MSSENKPSEVLSVLQEESLASGPPTPTPARSDWLSERHQKKLDFPSPSPVPPTRACVRAPSPLSYRLSCASYCVPCMRSCTPCALFSHTRPALSSAELSTVEIPCSVLACVCSDRLRTRHKQPAIMSIAGHYLMMVGVCLLRLNYGDDILWLRVTGSGNQVLPMLQEY